MAKKDIVARLLALAAEKQKKDDAAHDARVLHGATFWLQHVVSRRRLVRRNGSEAAAGTPSLGLGHTVREDLGVTAAAPGPGSDCLRVQLQGCSTADGGQDWPVWNTSVCASIRGCDEKEGVPAFGVPGRVGGALWMAEVVTAILADDSVGGAQPGEARLATVLAAVSARQGAHGTAVAYYTQAIGVVQRATENGRKGPKGQLSFLHFKRATAHTHQGYSRAAVRDIDTATQYAPHFVEARLYAAALHSPVLTYNCRITAFPYVLYSLILYPVFPQG